MYGGAIATDLGRHFEDSYGQLASLIMTLARFHILTRWKQKQHKTWQRQGFFRWQQQQSHKTWRKEHQQHKKIYFQTVYKNRRERRSDHNLLRSWGILLFSKNLKLHRYNRVSHPIIFCYFQRISHYIFINNRVSHLLPWCFCSRRALRASQADTIQTAGSFQRSFSVSSMKYIWHEWLMCVIRYDPCLTCIACHL